MSRRFTRLSLLFVLTLTSEAWAIGLGDIKLDSALNEPLRAEIVLLSANPEEVANLTVALASSETFERYGIDRPFYLQQVEFNVVDGGVNGSVVQIRSRSPITEPFLTFLVEATWSSGRLLREYTVLLDPPTYAPPAVQQAPAVAAPRRTTPTDSARIERQPTPVEPQPAPRRSVPAPQPSQPAQVAEPQPQPASQPEPEPQPEPEAPVEQASYATTAGGDLTVERGDTLWGIASRMRPDSRLTMNQTMLAIFEANKSAFGGNINLLRAGASLRIPSADEVFQISRGDAFTEVQRQNDAWGDVAYSAPEPSTRPSLTLVPPDEEPVGADYDDASAYQPQTREQEIEDRIVELETADVPNQQSLIEIRDNELAALRQELANIRGEVYEPVVDTAADEIAAEEAADAAGGVDDVMADDTDDTAVAADAETADAEAADAVVTPAVPSNVVRTTTSTEKTIVDQVIEFLTGIWAIIIGALVLVAGGLFWFMRRGAVEDEDDSGPLAPLDSDDVAASTMSATETMQAPSYDEAIVVVEQESGEHPILEDTVEAPVASAADETAGSGAFGSLEDTFSSETAVNLDQTDPIAEADFHMAYGLYDQAADLINGALETDPGDKALMSKLCEIYFVWGNRDAFVDAATNLKASVGEADNAEWDKIVIMGQQIAADHELFAGAGLGATKAVDLSFDDAGDDAGALDMDFGAADSSGTSDIIDLGAADEAADDDVDFSFDELPAESDESVDLDLDVTAQTPTLEEPFGGSEGGTAELPSLDEEALSMPADAANSDADETAEINLDDLDLGLDGLAETELASLDDIEATGRNEMLSDTGIDEAFSQQLEATGKNPELDVDDLEADDTGIRPGLDPDSTGLVEGLDLSDLDDSGMRLAADETGQNPLLTAEEESDPTDVNFDEDLLEATGHTQILSEDFVVDDSNDLSDDAATLLAPMDEDEDEFDFAKTEALPADVFASNMDLDETAEAPAISETDVDLDLDDLTAALQVSEIGDTIEQPRDDATVEQPRPTLPDETAAVPTMSISPDDMSTDLHEARTMTEVGTKLDLARAYVDMGDPAGARGILEEVLDEGDDGQKQQAQQLLDSLPG